MEDCKFSTSKEISPVNVQSEDSAHHLLRYLGNRPLWICTSWAECQSCLLLGSAQKTREKVRQKRHKRFAAKSWIMQVDKAPAHTVLSVWEFLASKQISMLEHPPYSPDLAPCNFFLFPLIKKHPKGTHFDDIEDIQNNMTTALMAIPHYEFQKCFDAWKKWWTSCVASQGNYFVGYHSATQQ